MFDCSSQMTKFHNKKVSLGLEERKIMKSRRDANRKRLKSGLEYNSSPLHYGCHTQGSYAMKTMIQDDNNDYDIDDGIYFKKEVLLGPKGAELSALQVRQMVCDALSSKGNFKTPPKVLKNCVRVYYNEGHHVDLPSYRTIEEKNFWTGETDIYHELASSSWKNSDPREVTLWFKSVNNELSPDSTSSNGGQFRRIVRLLKLFSKSRPSWKSNTASGFMITKLAQECFHPSIGHDDVSFKRTIENIIDRLTYSEEIEHPVIDGIKLTNDKDGRPAFFRNKLEENVKHLQILNNDECTFDDAMKAWDKLFNITWFSEQDSGNKASQSSPVVPNRAVRKQGGGRYA